MQEHVAKLQAELKAAQAAADLEATLREFKGFLDNGETPLPPPPPQQQQQQQQQGLSKHCAVWDCICSLDADGMLCCVHLLQAFQNMTCCCAPAGQFNDAAYHLVQLRKILEDTSSSSSSASGGKGSMPLATTELQQLQEACTRCTRDLEEVRFSSGGSSSSSSA
jgi:hypothetical protein